MTALQHDPNNLSAASQWNTGPRLRVVNWNLHGASVPGKASRQQQDRAWHYLAALAPDVALLQEVEWAAVPEWAKSRWQLVSAMGDTLGPDKWGSLIAVRTEIQTRARVDVCTQPWLHVLKGYVAAAEVALETLGPVTVASVHVPARTVRAYLTDIIKQPAALDPDEIKHLACAKLEPWCCDLVFGGLERALQGQRFIVAGDWNNARLFDTTCPQWAPSASEFFQRAKGSGWFECHESKGEQLSYLKKGTHPYQLDHVFCDLETGARMLDCSIRADGLARELSDHAPMITDFRSHSSIAANRHEDHSPLLQG